LILFCDTSALIKLYITEPESAALKLLLQNADAVAVCRIAWAEAHAALARRAREVPEDAAVIEQAKTLLAADWPQYVVMDIDQELVERAGEFADTFALRGYDSIQLAAAHRVLHTAASKVCFACFDLRLNKAAKILGLHCL
jgi:uncharacterized protein